ncbi:hypothetical protein L7F22_036619, partial [Adiantum nelumboides]|nr:hypothetical protein [Adiantum nelumboides]
MGYSFEKEEASDSRLESQVNKADLDRALELERELNEDSNKETIPTLDKADPSPIPMDFHK